MRRLQILRGQIQYKPELKDGEFFLDKTNHSLLIGDTSVADGQFELAKQSAITNLQQQVDTKITAAQAPVQSVNTKTGAVVLTAADVGAVPTTRTVNGKALSADITLTASDVGALPSTTKIPTYTLTKDETSADYAAVYHLTKDGTNVGVPINIPKDLFVESGEIVDNPTGQPEGKYIKLVLQNQTDPIYINVADLVDAYTAGNGITISNTNVVSANVSAGNGLSVDADGIKMAVASTDSAGAMSSADFTKLSGIETGAQKNTVTSVNGSTGAVTITVPTKVTDLTDAADYATVTSVNAVADDVEMLNDEVGTLTTDVSTLKTNITSKQNTITGGASTITDNNLTANRALISNSSGKVAVSDITDTELGYLDGVTSNIQTQIDGITVPTKTSELTNDSGYITQTNGDGRYLKLSGGALNGNTKVLNGKNITFYADETGEEIYVSMYMDGNYDFVISSAATAGNSIGRLKMYNVMTPTNSYMAANKYYVDQYAPHAKLITLTVAGWDSTAKTQTVTVSGILADESKQLIIPMPAVASMTAYNDAGIQCTGQAANSLTFTATTVPTAAISVYVTYQAVIS